MNSICTLRRGSEILLTWDLSLTGTLPHAALSILNRQISQDILLSTLLPGLVDGRSRVVSPACPMTSSGGPVRALANPSASPVSNADLQTNVISGQCGSISSESASPQSYSVNKSLLPQAPVTRGKMCVGCNEHKSFENFYTNSKGRVRKFCIECSKGQARHQKSGTTQQRSATFKIWRKTNRAKVLITAAKFRAKQKGMPFELDQYQEQIEARLALGLCEVTGMPFNMNGIRAWDGPSLDRIDSTQGYTIANTRLVLFALNVMMNTWGEGIVLHIAQALRLKQEAEATSFPNRFQNALAKRLARLGSTECVLTWKESVTPAGRPLSRLVPSTRPIEGTDCGLWPTMQHREGGGGEYADPEKARARLTSGHQVNLQDHVKAMWQTMTGNDSKPAGIVELTEYSTMGSQARDTTKRLRVQAAAAQSPWPTPTARDYRSESATDEFNEKRWSHPRGKPLSAMVWAAGTWRTPTVGMINADRAKDGKAYAERKLAKGQTITLVDQVHLEASGTQANSSSEQMEKPGALAPTFVAWLMGFPPEWLDCAPASMQKRLRS